MTAANHFLYHLANSQPEQLLAMSAGVFTWLAVMILAPVLASRRQQREDRARAVLSSALGAPENPSPVAARPDPETFVAARRNAERWMP